MSVNFDKYINAVKDVDTLTYLGRVEKIIGLTIEANGPLVQIGEICEIQKRKGEGSIKAEVVGFVKNRVLLMPLDEIKGIGPGSQVISTNKSLDVPVGEEMIGRVLDGLGRPIDNKGAIRYEENYLAENDPPDPINRKRIEEVFKMGIRSIDSTLTIGKGQRIGVFAGSGVGKSTILGMMARNSEADVNVIGLIGERGREVLEFMERDLGKEGMKKTVLVVSTSDKPALIRYKAAQVTTAIAEYFRDQGKKVLLMMDSLTRFAMAQREIGLAIGEPPVSRGYTPSVFAKLPRLLERTGTSNKATITAIYTVLVEGDEMNEPIADATRGILDGHIVLSRDLASKGHYPAIDITQSVSRVMPDITDDEHVRAAMKTRELISKYEEIKDMVSIGAYKKGSDKLGDEAISKIDTINDFLKQGIKETDIYLNSKERLMKIINESMR